MPARAAKVQSLLASRPTVAVQPSALALSAHEPVFNGSTFVQVGWRESVQAPAFWHAPAPLSAAHSSVSVQVAPSPSLRREGG